MKKFTKYVLQSAVPFSSVFRAGSAVAGSIQRTGDRLQAAKEALARSKARQEETRAAAVEDARLRQVEKLSSKEVFDRWYEEYGWSEQGLEERRKSYRWAKFAWLLGAIGSVVVIFMGPFAHWLVAMFLICSGLLGLFAFLGKAFFCSLNEARINLRSMLSVTEYVSRIDFFKRFLT